KYALTMLEPLHGLHEIDLLYDGGKEFDRDLLTRRLGIDLPGVRLHPYQQLWGMKRCTRDYHLFINATFGSLQPSRAAKSILIVFFPLPLDDDGSASFLEACDQQILRGQKTLLEILDILDKDLLQYSFAEYAALKGRLLTVSRLPLFLLRKLAWMRRLSR